MSIWLDIKCKLGLERQGDEKIQFDDEKLSIEIKKIRQLSLIAILGTVAIFAAWSIWAPLSVGTHALGKVIVESRNIPIQLKDAGIVQEISVVEGEVVKKGHRLLALQSVQVLAEYNIAAEQILRDEIVSEILRSELESRGPILTFEVYSKNGVSIERFNKIVQEEQAFFDSKKADLKSRIQLLDRQIDQIRVQSEGLREQSIGLRRQSELIEQELESVRYLSDRDLVSKSRLRATERDAEGIKIQLGMNQTQVAQNESQILTIEQNKLDQVQQFNSGLATDLRQRQVTIAQTREKLNVAADLLSKMEIFAPVDGQIVGLTVFARGSVIGAGQLIMSIVPNDGGLICEVQISPLEIDKVQTGSIVDVRFSGLPHKSAPILKGYLQSVSRDIIPGSGSNTSSIGQMGSYLGRVLLPQNEIDRIIDHRIVPGMPVEVSISAGKRTVLDYLISPWKDLAFRALRER